MGGSWREGKRSEGVQSGKFWEKGERVEEADLLTVEASCWVRSYLSWKNDCAIPAA